jgi:hypothetical protein
MSGHGINLPGCGERSPQYDMEVFAALARNRRTLRGSLSAAYGGGVGDVTRITELQPARAAKDDIGRPSTPAADRDLVVEEPRTADRADEIDLCWCGRLFLIRLPESAGGGGP